ncbi:MAG TPA: hypothetical protein DDZ89_01550 [Clostridiales bacterium]|nr:hypothetical protein [Clostridiales bacterium]
MIMICQKCKVREATVTITKLIHNMQITMHLCPECSKNFSQGIQKQISGVNNILMSMMDSGTMPEDENEDNLSCDKCGMTFADFRKKGTVGCEECYNVYREKFESILKRLHGSYRHVGLSYEGIKHAAPQKSDSMESKLLKKDQIKQESVAEQIGNLKKALEEAVEREEYEEAAKIRDMIKIMEDEPTGGITL